MSLSSPLDVNQIFKKVYDDKAFSFTTIPAYIPSTVWINELPASQSFTLSPINVLCYRVVGITVSWKNMRSPDATLTFQGSTNGVNWKNIGNPFTITNQEGFEQFSVIDEPYQYLQIVYAPENNTTGTLSADYMMRA